MKQFVVGAALFAAVAAASSTVAQMPAAPAMPGMQHGAMPGMTGAQMTPNHQEMMRGMERMNRDMMAAPMTGNPDRDLATMMIPHHQGAIDMARIYLRDGKDPEMRRIAEKIITDQEREIAEFKAWLAKNPAK